MTDRRDGRTEDGTYKLRWDVIATVIAWLVGGMLAYSSLDARISILEDRSIRVSQDLAEIKSDVKLLLRRQVEP